MEQKLGYSLIDKDNKEIKYWNYDPQPNPIILPNGDQLHAPVLNTYYSGYQLVERWQISNNTPGLVQIGQTISFDGQKIIVTIDYRDPDQDELMQYSASVRYNKETSGIVVSINFIYTDRQSQSMITGAIALMQLQPNTVISFKTGGGFISANSQTMTEIASAVASHVENCFHIENGAASNIQSNTITTFAEVDQAYN